MNPQMLFPHALDGFRHRLLNFAGCSHQLQPGEPLPAGKTGLGQRNEGVATLFERTGDIPMSCKLQEWFQGKCMASGNHIRADVFPSGRGLAADGERQALEKL